MLVRGGGNAIRALLKEIGFNGLMLQLALRALLAWREVALGKISIGRQELAWQLMREAEDAERDQSHTSENDDLAAFMRKIYLEITRANARAHAADIVVLAKQEEAIALVATATLEQDIAALMLADETGLDDELAIAFDQMLAPENAKLFEDIELDTLVGQSLPDAAFLAEFADAKPADYRQAA